MDDIPLISKRERERGLSKFVSFKRVPRIEFSFFSKLGLVLVLVAVLVGGGLYAWKFSLNKRVTDLKLELQQIKEQRNVALENELKNLSMILGGFKAVLDDHTYWTLFFKLLEDQTLNTITFKSFQGDSVSSAVIMQGYAPSFEVLAQQIKVFENTPGIVSANATGMTLSEIGEVNFGIKITFSKEIIRKK
jgi:hypothetical protein